MAWVITLFSALKALIYSVHYLLFQNTTFSRLLM